MNVIKEKNSTENFQDEKEIAKKSKSNFLFSFSLLNKDKNDALNTVYAYCRKTDDIADNDELSIETKFNELYEWRAELENAIAGGKSKIDLLNKLNSVIKKYNIPHEHFFDLINGMEMDLNKNRYYTFSELADYCYKVASNVGLMCIEIFGYKNPKTRDFAINLGIALQLTNIIRDIKSDARRNRIYIPVEDLRRFNYNENDLLENRYNEDFVKLMEFECRRARYFYEEANKSLSEEDKGLMFSARIMEHIYFRVLRKIERKHYNVFEKKVRISNIRKMLITAGVFIKYRILYNFDDSRLAINGK